MVAVKNSVIEKLCDTMIEAQTIDFADILANGQLALINCYHTRCKNDIIVDTESGTNAIYYEFNYKSNLWLCVPKESIITDLSNFVRVELEEMIIQTMKKNDHQKLITITKLMSKYTNSRYLEGALVYLNSKFQDNKRVKQFNNVPYHVHFLNGVYDLQKGIFRPRTKEDNATFCLEYDYQKTNPESIQKVKKIISQICNDDDQDTNFMLNWLGYSITGETGEQKFLYCVGHSASNGKSTIAKIFQTVFSEYSIEVLNRTFDGSYGKSHKQIAGMRNKRFVFLEELKRNNIDCDLIKRVVDGGKYKNEKLYGTTDEINLIGKLLITSNFDPIFELDEGIKRRGLALEFRNRFLDENDFKNQKGTYVKNKNLINNFLTPEYRNAFCNIIIGRATKYYQFGIKIPPKVIANFKEITEVNDKVSEFIENFYEITNDPNDKVSKDQFTGGYNAYFKTKVEFGYLLSDLKRLRISYVKDRRVQGVKGVIVGLKPKVIFENAD